MENGIYTSKDRDNAQLEVNALLQEIDKIADNTRFNDVKLLDGAYDQTIRAGNTNAETIRVSIDALTTAGTANISSYAVEKAIVDTGGVSADGTDTDLTAREGTSITIDTSLFSSNFKDVFKSDSLGTFHLTQNTGAAADANNTNFTIDAKTGKMTSVGTLAAGTYQMEVHYNNRAVPAVATPAHTEVITFIVTAAVDDATNTLTGTQLDDIQVETAAESSRAVETLDKALEEVSSAQAKLGAIQNRLQHNIDNLSKSAMLTEQSVGRVVDADFATETSNLSKQQILNQAATAMLAQANQSKQSVLSLLQ